MSNWSTTADIRKQLEKAWRSGKFLNPIDSDCRGLFPFIVKLKFPGPGEISNDFSACQAWIKQFNDTAYYRIEWKEANHRRFGKNKLPVSAVFGSLLSVLVFLDKQEEHRLYHQLAALLMDTFPALDYWLIRYPFKVLLHQASWRHLISVTQWMLAHPWPDIYIRQISVPGVDSKFIGQHKKLLTQWWDILLDEEDVNHNVNGIKLFEQRFGFKSKPLTLHFRILDASCYIAGLSDICVTVDEFSRLELGIDRVFVTENDINGLVFPNHPKSIVIFGRGYGFDYLSQIDWLHEKEVYYWGDIDTHGFAILSQFRQHIPQAQSLLMDAVTLEQHRSQWVREQKQSLTDLHHLSGPELKLYNQLRDNQVGERVRLEQEFIAYSSLMVVLDAL